MAKATSVCGSPKLVLFQRFFRKICKKFSAGMQNNKTCFCFFSWYMANYGFFSYWLSFHRTSICWKLLETFVFHDLFEKTWEEFRQRIKNWVFQSFRFPSHGCWKLKWSSWCLNKIFDIPKKPNFQVFFSKQQTENSLDRNWKLVCGRTKSLCWICATFSPYTVL